MRERRTEYIGIKLEDRVNFPGDPRIFKVSDIQGTYPVLFRLVPLTGGGLDRLVEAWKVRRIPRPEV